MDPWIVYRLLKPLEKYGYKLLDILYIVYPLREKWRWENILKTGDADIKKLFSDVHLTTGLVKLGKGGHPVPEWCVDADYNDTLYKKLYVFFKGDEDSSEESEKETAESSESSITLGEKIQEEESMIIRDGLWRDDNPIFNPRLQDDIESGFVQIPTGCKPEDLTSIIDAVKNANEDEFVCADTAEIKSAIEKENLVESLGLYGKKGSLKSAKIIAFFKSVQKDYSLVPYDVEQYVKKVKSRKAVWKWINVGVGHYRDFEWRLVGNRDMITKLIRMCYLEELQPLPPRADKGEYDFDPSPLWEMEPDECLDIETGKIVKRNDRWVDAYGWTGDKKEKMQIRKYIHDKFVEKWSYKWIPGKSTKWCVKFFEAVKNREDGEYIDFETVKPIKFSVSSSLLYDFSKCGFAKLKTLKYTNKEIEFHLLRFLNNKGK